jgi:hypothetical protein
MSYLIVSKDLFDREVIDIRKEISPADLLAHQHGKKQIYAYLGNGEFRELRWCMVL